MKYVRSLAAAVLLCIAVVSMFPGIIVSEGYEEQFRDRVDEAPSARFPLGTDSLGRNRLSRLLHGTRTSLLLAPAAALAGVFLAVFAGVAAVSGGQITNRIFEFLVDLMGSLPWLFVLIALRAVLPLDVSPTTATAATFALLAVLGWAAPARVFRNVAASARRENWWLQADACGIHPFRIWSRHLAAAIWPVAASQVWINIPVFVLSEANLGLLGLGVAEPTPSLGNLMRELENLHAFSAKPWLLAPVCVLALTTLSLYVLGRSREARC
jgi:peptide/nickel transport system permease protein